MEEITSGKVEIGLKYESTQIFSETLDLCELTTRVNMSCPLKKGHLKINGAETIPWYAPSVSQ